jgi:hypothetical protein
MAGSFVIRQSKTILARYCESGWAKYHFAIAVWRAKEAESRRNDQRLRLRVGSVGSLNVYRGVPRGDAQGLFGETWSVNGQGQKGLGNDKSSRSSYARFVGSRIPFAWIVDGWCI